MNRTFPTTSERPRMRSWSPAVLLAAAVITALLAGSACGQSPSASSSSPPPPPAQNIQPVGFGDPFPALAFDNMMAAAGGPERVDLGTVLGTKPIVLVYWVAGHPRADEVIRRVQEVVEEAGADSIALYGVAIERPGREASSIVARAQELGLTMPILDDDGFRLGQMLRVQTVPHVAMIDKEGRLRLANGASLSQTLGYKVTLESAIRTAANTGEVGTYGYLPHYYPVTELVGKKCPEFSAPLLGTNVEQDWSTMIKDDQVNVLIFWSVECPHCRRSLPEINEWLKANGSGVNVVSAANVTNEAIGTKTKEFCEQNDFVFPTLADRDLEISRLYQVTSTPTILVIRPDGVVDSIVDPSQNFGDVIDRKKKEILGS